MLVLYYFGLFARGWLFRLSLFFPRRNTVVHPSGAFVHTDVQLAFGRTTTTMLL
jgi:hypothetical protein